MHLLSLSPPCCLMQMIDEFSDISRGEKEIMKMWNVHALNERW